MLCFESLTSAYFQQRWRSEQKTQWGFHWYWKRLLWLTKVNSCYCPVVVSNCLLACVCCTVAISSVGLGPIKKVFFLFPTKHLIIANSKTSMTSLQVFEQIQQPFLIKSVVKTPVSILRLTRRAVNARPVSVECKASQCHVGSSKYTQVNSVFLHKPGT